MSDERGPGLDPTGDPLLAALSEAARRTAADEAGPGPTPAVWHRLQAMRARPTRIRWAGVGLIAAGVAAAAGAIVAVQVARRPRPLTYAAVAQGMPDQGAEQAAEQGAQQGTQDDGYIRGVGPLGTEVRFSDGTRIALPRGARLSVLSRASEGARLRVEDGEAHFEVVHRPRAAWTVEAGPFVVYVTGTSFDVRWSGRDETVEVRLRSGSVRIGGPFLPERVTLRPGQRLSAKLATRELRIDEGRADAPVAVAERPVAATATAAERPVAATATAESPVAAAPGEVEAVIPVPAAEAAAPLVRTVTPHRVRTRSIALAREARSFAPGGWAAAVAAGGGAVVVAEAEAHGIDRSLAEVDGAALVALGDAARYNGRPELAVRVLLSERTRFGGTPPAETAAFLLGRLADDKGDFNAALGWYRRYLGEAPRGPYAAEALGREMLTVERISGRPAAHDIAAEYVRRFANGTYLLQAHSILANP